MSARRDPALKRLYGGQGIEDCRMLSARGEVTFWCCQAGLPADRTEVVNMRELSTEDAATAVLNDTVEPNLPADGSVAATEGENLTMAIADETTLRIVLYQGDGAASLMQIVGARSGATGAGLCNHLRRFAQAPAGKRPARARPV